MANRRHPNLKIFLRNLEQFTYFYHISWHIMYKFRRNTKWENTNLYKWFRSRVCYVYFHSIWKSSFDKHSLRKSPDTFSKEFQKFEKYIVGHWFTFTPKLTDICLVGRCIRSQTNTHTIPHFEIYTHYQYLMSKYTISDFYYLLWITTCTRAVYGVRTVVYTSHPTHKHVIVIIINDIDFHAK